jgi:hypothetical protein
MTTTPSGEIGRQVDPNTAVLAGADRLLHGASRIQERDVRDRIEALRLGAAELGEPSIVRAGVGGSEVAVGHMPFPADPDGRVEQDSIDPLAVHDPESRQRIVRAGRTPFGIAHLPSREQLARVHGDPAQGAELPSERLEGSTIDDQDLVPFVVARDPNGPIPV